MEFSPPSLASLEISFRDESRLTELNPRTYRMRTETGECVVKFGPLSQMEHAKKNSHLAAALDLPVVEHHIIAPINGLSVPIPAQNNIVPPDAIAVMPYVPARPCDKTWKEMPPRKISEFCWNTLACIPQINLACLIDFAPRNVLCMRQKLQPVFIDMEAGFFTDPKYYAGRDNQTLLNQSHYYLRKSAALYLGHTLGDEKDKRERFTMLMLNGCDMLDKKTNDPQSALMKEFGTYRNYFQRRIGSMREALTDANLQALIFG